MSAPPPRRSARLAKSNTVPEMLVEPELPRETDRVEPATSGTPKKTITMASPATPATYALKPPSTEMHPSKFHPTTAEPSSALRLGFTDITAARKRDSSHGAGLQSTPTKVGGVPSSAFTLRVPNGGDYLGLGPEALRVLEGLKEKAAEYKADIIAQRANESTSASTDGKGRTIATPKGKSGRFSAAHMAEFKKMDSIEGHASAWRAQNGRFQPVVKPGVKRSLSKANLDTPQSSLKRTPSKAEAGSQSSSSLPPKRFKKSAEDDASTTRPVMRESTSVPRPASSVKRPAASRIARPSLSRLMSPTKSSLANAVSPRKSEVPVAVPSPKPTFKSRLEALKESRGLKESREMKETKERSVMKSVFGSSIFSPRRQSSIPQPVVTPPRFSNLNLNRLAATQPLKKVVKHVTFTPEVTRTIFDPDSLTLYKTSAIKKILQRSETKEALAQQDSGNIAYPDLSAYKDLLDTEPESAKSPTPTPSIAGKFTFRSDHTIKFGQPSPIGFGASPGQSSVRQVRNSIKSKSDMPGSFPEPVSPSSHPDKENAAPSPPKVLSGVPHGMSNKKRHRADSVDGDTDKEAADRAGKKAKSSHVPEGQALLAPRLASTPSASTKKPTMARSVGKTPTRPINRPVSSVSPSKKRPTLSMSRLNMLAQPKNRG
ncbi:hypothetical protein M441DRAFT_181340 [Trichoderma asperellum CBS 433.97]|uniref:Erythromycin esterase n=1 Tax=Trichoderma asperellum (strain ATCC 204424 / CBS 433.97 / NBRC 101777) TaxID=1042311 RepID=A0A2T3ZN44_TRIA4|nr:hypothetical protein M441DRAFT_181340 [Trichoderma asperellum CBS 433.97]PTB46231.1 hypothetical protein M441DRAFT_181340 [Trichoderma asperellum CBS 433.97]